MNNKIAEVKIENEIEFHRKHLHDGSPNKKFRKGYISGLLKAWKILKDISRPEIEDIARQYAVWEQEQSNEG